MQTWPVENGIRLSPLQVYDLRLPETRLPDDFYRELRSDIEARDFAAWSEDISKFLRSIGIGSSKKVDGLDWMVQKRIYRALIARRFPWLRIDVPVERPMHPQCLAAASPGVRICYPRKAR